ncbi:PREDICTED: testis-expressed sequence 35 protein, partial [Elephantulus edwardii]|uniref:testis-expressed sequence 35 protein n=1 Tax=Elephantulus edwardii TaxID=28737 RepID=UPI0003F0B079
LKDMQKDMDEKMDLLINIQKNNKLKILAAQKVRQDSIEPIHCKTCVSKGQPYPNTGGTV